MISIQRKHRQTVRRIAFVSSNDVWGGSEELWSRAALVLAEQGHALAALKPRLDRDHPRIAALSARGCALIDLFGPGWMPRKLRSMITLVVAWKARMYRHRLRTAFRALRPDLAVISQGLNYDGRLMARACHALGVPFALVSQKADNLYWPTDSTVDELRTLYQAARAAFFVSEHNLRLTEQQLGCPLPNARVVRNPFEVSWHGRDDWPDPATGIHLACLARLDVREKGQDLLLRVLSMPKWRARPVRVALFGSGHNAEALAAMAHMLELTNVAFMGFTPDPGAVWADHHALVLPSRCEGLPLSLVEAMLSSRVAIVTDVGGSGELVRDGETGFLAAAATEAELDAALERAWARRGDWPSIGKAAAAQARTLVPPDPAANFAADLVNLIDTAA